MARGVLYLMSADLARNLSNVLGLAGTLSDLTMASCQYDTLLCSETLVQICVTCRRCWFPVLDALSCCVG